MKTIAKQFPWTVKLVMLAVVLMLTSNRGWSQTQVCSPDDSSGEVQTDLPHYLPSETVHIGGRYYARSCAVVVRISRPDGSVVKGDGVSAGSDTVPTDEAGAFNYTYQLGGLQGIYSVDVLGQNDAVLATARFSSGPYVMTDRPEYRPGESVTLTGRGWQPGEAIVLLVQEAAPVGCPDCPSRTFTAMADSSGVFLNQELLLDQRDLHRVLTVTAAGQSSGIVARTTFKDGAIILVQSARNQNGSGTTETATFLNVPVEGNLLIAIIACRNAVTFNSPPVGWTPAIKQDGAAPSQAIFYKVAGQAEPKSFTITWATSSAHGLHLYEYSGAATVSPLDGTPGSASGTGSSMDSGTPTISSAHTDDLLLAAFVNDSGGSITGYTNSFTLLNDFNTTGGGSNTRVGAAGRNSSSGTGTDANTTSATSNSGPWRGQIVAFKAASTKLDQTITVTTAAPGSAAYNSTFPVAATASSGLNVAISTAGGCSGSGTSSATITMTSSTTACVVHYNQAGDATRNPAPEVTSSTSAARANQTIGVTTPAPATAEYGSAFNVSASASSTLGVAITATGGCSGTGTNSAAITMASGTTACVVHYNQAGDSNYNAAPEVTSSTSAALKAASVTPDPAGKVYGAPEPALSGTLSGFLPADNVTAAYGRTAGETVLGGPYTISATLSPASVLSNYNIAYNTAVFSITTKAALVTPDPATKVYGAAEPTLTGALSGFLPADNVTAAYGRTAGETVLGGPYTISATLSPAEKLSNYNITYRTAVFSITTRAASVTPDPASKVYGAAEPALTGTLSGFLATDNVTAAYGRTAGETVAGGPYTISAVLSPADKLSNYSIVYNTAAFTISKAPASVTLGGLAQTYDGAPKSASATTDPAGLPVAFTYDGLPAAPINAGHYAVVGTVSDPNYQGSNAGTLVIAPAATVITWLNPADITYGTALDGTQLNATAGVAGGFVYTPPAGTVLGAGDGQTLSVAFTPDSPNYSGSTASVLINVKQFELTVTGITASDKVYDGNSIAALNKGLAALVGVRPGDSVDLHTESAAGAFADKNVNVGPAKPVTVSGLTISGGQASNYKLTQPTATANITPLALMVADVTADSKVYDGNADAVVHAGSAALSGVLEGDSVSLAGKDTANTGTFSDKNVGTGKTVAVAGLSLSGADAGNYSIQPAAKANITQRLLTANVSADDKVYDGTALATVHVAVPALTGVLGTDAVSLTGTASGAFADADAGGPKNVTVTGVSLDGADSGNYKLSEPITSKASINKATASISVTPYSVTYNGAAHTATGSATGVGGANLSAQLDLSGTTHTNAGSYSDTWNFTGGTNYKDDSGPVSDEITRASQTITFGALADKHYGEPDFNVGAAASSGLAVSFTASGPCAVSGNSVHLTGVGTCTVTAHQSGNANYAAATDVPRSFNITDNTAPDTAITGGPAASTTSTSATFSFTGSDDVTPPGGLSFQCKLDAGSFSPCVSGQSYGSLTLGLHAFQVEAADAAGNMDATPATWSWTVVSGDTTPPDTLIDSAPSSFTTGTSATLSFHSTETPATFQCKLDADAFAPCSSPKTYTGLAPGAHTFSVQAKDAANNTDPTPAAASWTVLSANNAGTLEVSYIVHHIDDDTKKPKSHELAVPGAEVRVFIRGAACTDDMFVNKKPKHWGPTFESCPFIASGVTDSDGRVSITVPPTSKKPNEDYVVIGKTPAGFPDNDADDLDSYYSGKQINELKAGESRKVNLRKIRTFAGKTIPANDTEDYGSYLLIVQPDYLDWTDTVEQYPFILKAEGEWAIATSIVPPEGFVADTSELATVAADTTTGLQFTLTDVGSDWTQVTVTHDITHKGKKIKHTAKVPMFDKKAKKPKK